MTYAYSFQSFSYVFLKKNGVSCVKKKGIAENSCHDRDKWNVVYHSFCDKMAVFLAEAIYYLRIL